MPQVTVYIRNGDLPKWRALEKKSQWIHERLLDHQELKPVIEHITKQPAAPVIQSAEDVLEDEDDEIWGSLDSTNLIYSRADKWIFDRTTLEPLDEIFPPQVKDLIKRGQVK